LIDCHAEAAEIINLDQLLSLLEKVPADAYLLLLRTGFEVYRPSSAAQYALKGLGLGPEVGDWLRANRQIRMLGIDFISISSFWEIGRDAHRAFLGPYSSGSAPVLLIEDITLAPLSSLPSEIWVIPLQYTEAGGLPVTVIARYFDARRI
jgi:kynurenine formamidase